MNASNPPPPATPEERPAQIHHGTEHGVAHDEQLKRIVRQHPGRDEPRVDSVEPPEVPPGR